MAPTSMSVSVTGDGFVCPGGAPTLCRARPTIMFGKQFGDPVIRSPWGAYLRYNRHPASQRCDDTNAFCWGVLGVLKCRSDKCSLIRRLASCSPRRSRQSPAGAPGRPQSRQSPPAPPCRRYNPSSTHSGYNGGHHRQKAGGIAKGEKDVKVGKGAMPANDGQHRPLGAD